MKWLFALLMLGGVALTLIPNLPGVAITYGLSVLYGLLAGWDHVRTSYLVGGLLLVVLSTVAEQYLKAWGARRFGGSRWGSWGAVIGGLVGAFFLPLGLVIGPFLGAFLGEALFGGRDMRQAARVGLGGVIGVLGGMAGNIVVALALWIGFLVFSR